MTADAQARGWGPHGGLSGDKLARVDCPGIPLRVRREVAPLFAELVRWLTVERARHGAPALSSSGGYNDRPIEGSHPVVWSNHAWGLAVDLNAATNPRAHGGATDMPPGTSAKAASLGMRWGGDYTPPTKRDAMHFEFMGPPTDAARRVAALQSTSELRPGKTVTDRTPPQEDDVLSYVWNTTSKKVFEVDRRARTWKAVPASTLTWAPEGLVKQVKDDGWQKGLKAA